MKTAVVYFTRTRSTEKIAQLVAQDLNADLLQVRSDRYPTGLRGYLRALNDAFRQETVPIHTGDWNMADYDLVVIGTPVWASHIAAPIRSFLLANASKIRHAAFFATCGGTGADEVLKRMAAIQKSDPVATLALTAKDLSRPTLRQKITLFTDRIRHLQNFSQPSPAI